MKIKKFFKFLFLFILLILLIPVMILGVDFYVKQTSQNRIISQDRALRLENVDCIIVLGCQVKGNGVPSTMLSDRLRTGISLYKNGAAPKILMSGDHGTKNYDEVNTMKKTAINKGIPSKNVFMDHAGFSTYESMYRAKEIFDADKVIIVTQKYHLYRAIYIAKALGIDAYGVACDYNVYSGQHYREIREIFARCKDFVKVIFKPEPTFLGEKIPISGNGNKTNG